MTTKPFASSADLQATDEVLEVLVDGVYALTAGGDPTVGAVEGEDFLVCFEARATPHMAGKWLQQLRELQGDVGVLGGVLRHRLDIRVAVAPLADDVVGDRLSEPLVDEEVRLVLGSGSVDEVDVAAEPA